MAETVIVCFYVPTSTEFLTMDGFTAENKGKDQFSFSFFPLFCFFPVLHKGLQGQNHFGLMEL